MCIGPWSLLAALNLQTDLAEGIKGLQRSVPVVEPMQANANRQQLSADVCIVRAEDSIPSLSDPRCSCSGSVTAGRHQRPEPEAALREPELARAAQAMQG
jgi:hypothetical protein